MPRKILEEELESDVTNIDSLINSYFIANKEKKDAEAITKEKGELIKKYLKENGLKEYEGTEHIAKITTSESISYDDVKLLELVKTLPKEYQDRLVDTVQVVNVEKLEREIIQNNLKVEQFKEAEEKKVTVKLYVK